MKPPYITDDFFVKFIQSALAEDIGDGDHSTLGAVPETSQSSASLLVKDHGLLAGVDLAREIFKTVDPALQLEVRIGDGQHVKHGDIAFVVSGPSRSILSSERLVLNCMQRMSGIATVTKKLLDKISGTKAKILDTRKTTPNFRLLEKWAVLIGGGYNHRIGLFDMIMLKDNHIDISGGIHQAINATKDYLRASGKNLKIEVETRTLEEVKQALDANADIIMLDNMSPDLMRQAVTLIQGKALTEASGGITLETIREVAETGVDYISVGALTHSVRSLDLSLKVNK